MLDNESGLCDNRGIESEATMTFQIFDRVQTPDGKGNIVDIIDQQGYGKVLLVIDDTIDLDMPYYEWAKPYREIDVKPLLRAI